MTMRRMLIVAALAVGLALAGCGKKAPLRAPSEQEPESLAKTGGGPYAPF